MTPTTQKNKSHNQSLLVVDDDALVLATLADGLRDAGYNVVEASSGEEALALANKNEIDLAILDIRMPGMSGIEAARSLYDNRGIPFLFLSAFNDTATVSSAISEGALGYLLKPIDVDHMLPTIQTALTRSVDIKTLQNTKKNLTTALNQERDISIAIGIILANSSCNAIEAEQAMRKFARSHHLKMHDIALQILHAANNLKNLIQQITAIT